MVTSTTLVTSGGSNDEATKVAVGFCSQGGAAMGAARESSD